MAYTVEEKAGAVALVQTGMSAAKAATELKLPERSVQLWVAEYRELSADDTAPILSTQSYRVAQRAGELIERGLEYMAGQEDEALSKSMFVLNAIRGTALDKLIKKREGRMRVILPTIILGKMESTTQIPAQGEVIEVEFTEQ